MTSMPVSRWTPQQYLAIERQAEFRSEFYNGEMFAMAGASRRHNLIVGNAFAPFHRQLAERDCEVYQGNMRVKISCTGLYFYPNVVVACDLVYCTPRLTLTIRAAKTSRQWTTCDR